MKGKIRTDFSNTSGIWLLIFILFFAIKTEGKVLSSKKYVLSVCAVVRNEAKYLEEWIEFHRIIGVDHFYLYNNNSSERLDRILRPYLKKRLVTLVSWPDRLGPILEQNRHHWALAALIPAYENAIVWTAGKETKWLALLTTDEFLVPIESLSIKEFLNKYDEAPAIILESDIFDASQTNLFLSKKLLIESINMTTAPCNLYTAIPQIIIKPEDYAGCEWPPYQLHFKNDRQPIYVKKASMRINRYINRDCSPVVAMKHRLYLDPRQLSPQELSSILEKDYCIEDPEQAILRFLPILKTSMQTLKIQDRSK